MLNCQLLVRLSLFILFLNLSKNYFLNKRILLVKFNFEASKLLKSYEISAYFNNSSSETY